MSSSSISSFSEIKKYFEPKDCSICSKNKQYMGKIEHVCTHVLCNNYLNIVCKFCHETYHQSQLYSVNKKYIKSIQEFLEEFYYFVKAQNDKFELINVIIKSASTNLPENFPNYEKIFKILKEINLDITKNQLNDYTEIFDNINTIFMTEQQSEQQECMQKIKSFVTFNCCTQFKLINSSPFEDLEKNFSDLLKQSIQQKTVNIQMLQDFLTKRERKVELFKNQFNRQKNQIFTKIDEIHKECILDRKENCKGNNKGSLTNINDPCIKGSKSPSCEECIDAFDFYNKKLEQVF